MLANCYPGSCHENNPVSGVVRVRRALREARLQDEGLDRVVGIDGVVREESEHLAAGQTLDHGDGLVAKRSLEDPPQAANLVLAILVLQRALRLGHRVVEHGHDEAVLDVRPGASRATAGRLLEEGNQRPGDLPIEVARGGFLAGGRHASMRDVVEVALFNCFLAYIRGMCSGWRRPATSGGSTATVSALTCSRRTPSSRDW